MTVTDDGDDGELTDEQFERRQELIERLLALLTDDTLREDTEDAIEASQDYGPLSLTQLTASEALNDAHSALQTFKHAQSVAVMLQTLGLEEGSLTRFPGLLWFRNHAAPAVGACERSYSTGLRLLIEV